MKKILVISGSHRKNGIGIKLFKLFKSSFSESDYDFETVHLSEHKIEFCRGCTACFKVGEHRCPCKDDVPDLVEKMKGADGLVVISPVYGMDISGQLKTFMDRITYLYHRPTLIGKPVIYLSSTDLGGMKITEVYMRYILNVMGLRMIGFVGALSTQFKKSDQYRLKLESKLNRVAKVFKKALSGDTQPKPKFNEIFHFTKWQVKNKYSESIYLADYKYWQENGWLDADYYYPTKLNIMDKIRIGFVKTMITRLMKKRLK